MYAEYVDLCVRMGLTPVTEASFSSRPAALNARVLAFFKSRLPPVKYPFFQMNLNSRYGAAL